MLSVTCWLLFGTSSHLHSHHQPAGSTARPGPSLTFPGSHLSLSVSHPLYNRDFSAGHSPSPLPPQQHRNIVTNIIMRIDFIQIKLVRQIKVYFADKFKNKKKLLIFYSHAGPFTDHLYFTLKYTSMIQPWQDDPAAWEQPESFRSLSLPVDCPLPLPGSSNSGHRIKAPAFPCSAPVSARRGVVFSLTSSIFISDTELRQHESLYCKSSYISVAATTPLNHQLSTKISFNFSTKDNFL